MNTLSFVNHFNSPLLLLRLYVALVTYLLDVSGKITADTVTTRGALGQAYRINHT